MKETNVMDVEEVVVEGVETSKKGFLARVGKTLVIGGVVYLLVRGARTLINKCKSTTKKHGDLNAENCDAIASSNKVNNEETEQ